MPLSAPLEGEVRPASAETSTASAEKTESGKNVDATRQKINEKVNETANIRPSDHPDLRHDNPKYRDIIRYTKLPDVPDAKTVATTLAAGASIALPIHVGIPVATALGANAAWKRLRKLPVLSNIDNGVRAVARGIGSFAAARWQTVSYLPKTARAIGLNALKFVPNTIGRIGQFGVNRYHDLTRHTPGESKSLSESVIDTVRDIPRRGVDIAHSTMNGLAKAVQYAIAHPGRTVLGLSFAAGILSFHGGPLVFSERLVEAILKIFEGAGTWISGGGAGAAASSAVPSAAPWTWKWW